MPTDQDHERSTMLDAFAASAEELLGAQDCLKRRLRLAGRGHTFESQSWRALADAGWISALIPEQDGGLGLGIDAAAVLAEAAGRHLLPEPFVVAGAQCAVILAACPEGRRRSELLTSLAAGTVMLGSAWQEDAGEIEPGPCTATITTRSPLRTLTGVKAFVEPGDGATGWIVLARDAGIPVLAFVAADSVGIDVQRQSRIDGGQWATLRFESVVLKAQDILAMGPAALDALRAGVRTARLLQAAELVGVSRRALQLTLEYVRARAQFGKPIGSFQALQHRLVDAAIQLEVSSATLREAVAKSTDARSTDVYADRAKARAALSALSITRLAIQMHGALGITHECAIGHYFTRAVALNASLGTSRELRNRWSQREDDSDAAEPAVRATVERSDPQDWNALSDAEFRGIYRRFLETHYPAEFRHLPLQYVHHEQIREWNRILFERGWRAPAWPKEYGGMGLSPAKLIALHEEKERHGVARWTDQGCELLGPLLIRFGTPEQRNRYLPKILSGEHVWCQGYSEPNAGSDLASVRMTAELDGDHFVVNGRKIWTSYAHEATHIFLLVRTEKTPKPAAGISFLLAEMTSPGISLRTIPDLAGDESFCEVEFANVSVPRENLVGQLNGGWALAKSLLGHERLFIGNPASVNYVLAELRLYAEHRGLFASGAFRERYAEVALDVADLNALYGRFADVARRGQEMPAEVSMLKVYCTEVWQRVSALLSETASEPGACLAPYTIRDRAVHLLAPTFNALPGSIYGGSNEIQRNILARQVLGLPS